MSRRLALLSSSARPVLPLVVGAALLASCDDGAGSTRADVVGDGRGDVAACEAPADLVITAVDAPAGACLARVPTVGEAVSLEGGRLRVGTLDLPLEPGASCDMIVAQGCASDTTRGDREAARVSFDVAAGRLTVTAERAEAFRPDACEPVVLSVAPLPEGCHLGGRFEVAAATLTAGSCDLSWPAATLVVSVGDDVQPIGTVSWGERSYDIVAVDRAACTVTAETDLLLFNGVARETRLVVTLGDDAASVAIEDTLEGTSDFGETCVDARFASSGARTPPGGAAWDASCDALPFVCGDGTCALEAGEQCEVCPEDCGCASGSCLRVQGRFDAELTHACASACADSTGCGADERCVLADEVDAFFVTGQPATRVCLAATGDAPLGGGCEDSRGCLDDRRCAQGMCVEACASGTCDVCTTDLTVGMVCALSCSEETPDTCGAGACGTVTRNALCSSHDGGASWFCHPAQVEHGCRPEAGPGFAAACGEDATCGVGLGCLGEACTRDGTRFDCVSELCTRPCEDDADCAAPLSQCSSISPPGQPASRWCTSPSR